MSPMAFPMYQYDETASGSTSTTMTFDPWATDSTATYGNYAIPYRVERPPRVVVSPPNFATPRTLPRRQGDLAPGFTLAQHGYWLNNIGRRLT